LAGVAAFLAGVFAFLVAGVALVLFFADLDLGAFLLAGAFLPLLSFVSLFFLAGLF